MRTLVCYFSHDASWTSFAAQLPNDLPSLSPRLTFGIQQYILLLYIVTNNFVLAVVLGLILLPSLPTLPLRMTCTSAIPARVLQTMTGGWCLEH